MKSLLKRHAVWIITAVLLFVISILVYIWRTPPCPENMKWYQCVAKHVYGYLSDWSVIFSAVGTLLLAVIAFWTIFRERRSQAS